MNSDMNSIQLPLVSLAKREPRFAFLRLNRKPIVEQAMVCS
jgi:hypothetical protein